MLPTFIGIGAPKAGTTWLANVLAGHPDISFAPHKETDYFSYRYKTIPIGDYASWFGDDDSKLARGEFSVQYLGSADAPAQIHEHIPNSKLIVSFRNPVEQVYSHYWHLQRQNFHKWDASMAEVSFEEALSDFRPSLIDPAMYADHLERWLQYFPIHQFKTILFDDIKRDPEGVIESIFQFVGVAPSWRPPTLRETGSRARHGTAPRSATAARWGGRVYDALNRYAYHPLKKAVGVERAASVKDALRVRTLLEALFRKKGYPEMNASTRSELLALFEEPNRRLGELIGRDLSHWNE